MKVLKGGIAYTVEQFDNCDLCDREKTGAACIGHTQEHRPMTEQEFMQEQSRIRAIKYNPTSTQAEKDSASAEWEAHMKAYPTITGTFTYSDADVQEARRHGYYE